MMKKFTNFCYTPILCSELARTGIPDHDQCNGFSKYFHPQMVWQWLAKEVQATAQITVKFSRSMRLLWQRIGAIQYFAIVVGCGASDSVRRYTMAFRVGVIWYEYSVKGHNEY